MDPTTKNFICDENSKAGPVKDLNKKFEARSTFLYY